MSVKTTDRELTAAEKEIKRIRGVDRDKRSEQQSARLAELLAEERRGRWNRLHVNRIKRFKASVKVLAGMGNP